MPVLVMHYFATLNMAKNPQTQITPKIKLTVSWSRALSLPEIHENSPTV